MGASTVFMRLDTVEEEKMQGILSAQTLPSTSSTDNGKVLGVYQGKWAKTTPKYLPAVTASDNGKVLMVVDGEWAVASLPTGE